MKRFLWLVVALATMVLVGCSNNAGGGTGGNGDGKLSGTGFMREKNESDNQRFLIHILPKTSIPKKNTYN